MKPIRWKDGFELDIDGNWRVQEIEEKWYVIGHRKIFPQPDNETALQKMFELRGMADPRIPVQTEKELYLRGIAFIQSSETSFHLSITGSHKKDGEPRELVNLVLSKEDAINLRNQLNRLLGKENA